MNKTFFLIAFISLTTIGQSFATSQWSRKYKVNCQTCHTAFPRLNYYGEKFMKNGYQDHNNEMRDGSKLRKKTYGNVDLATYVGDFLGARVNIDAVKYQTHGTTINSEKKEASIDLAKFKWAQIFIAGSIYKDVSFFDEVEFGGTGTLKHGWARLGFHNLLDTTALNVYVGKTSPADFTIHSDRLRLLSNKGKAIGRKSSTTAGSTTAESETSPRDGQYAVQYFGYKEGLTWALGVGNGSETTDANGELNYWGSVMYQMEPENDFHGSGVSVLYYDGTDTANSASSASSTQTKNDWSRIIPGINLRYKDWDIIASYTIGEDKNDSLTAVPTKTEFTGKTLIVSKMITTTMHAGIQYDDLRYDKIAQGNQEERLTIRYSYMPKENIAMHFLLEKDLIGEHDGNEKYHDSTFTLNLRTMF